MLKEQPANTMLLVARARTLANLGENAEAQTAYRRALEENPLDVASRRALAELQVLAKDEAAAKATLNEGLKADPGNADLMQALVAVVMRTEGVDPALAMADQLARDPANLPAARWLRGNVLMAAGRFIDAIPVFSAELRSEPSTTGVLRVVTALNASGRADQATALLRDWMAKHPTDATAAEALASLDLIARRFFDAERSLQVVLSQRPSDSAALNNLAWVYQQRSDPRARMVAQKSYLLNPTPEAADTLGWILVTGGNATTGLALLRQARAQLPRDPTVTYHLAVALKDTGKTEEAAKLLGLIVNGLQNFDDRPAAAKLLAELVQTK
jgi:predicted Zn-dependent protease